VGWIGGGKEQPATTVHEIHGGSEPADPGFRSRTSFVPVLVPLLLHSSRPWLWSAAEKKASPPTFASRPNEIDRRGGAQVALGRHAPPPDPARVAGSRHPRRRSRRCGRGRIPPPPARAPRGSREPGLHAFALAAPGRDGHSLDRRPRAVRPVTDPTPCPNPAREEATWGLSGQGPPRRLSLQSPDRSGRVHIRQRGRLLGSSRGGR
jgi:hypothetical protein